SRARLSMPAPVVALPWGSRSTRSTRRFIAARLAARLTAVVVFPTPPFWFTTARILLTCAPLALRAVSPRGSNRHLGTARRHSCQRHHDQVTLRVEAWHGE